MSVLSLWQRLRYWFGWDDRPRDRLRKLRERELGECGFYRRRE